MSKENTGYSGSNNPKYLYLDKFTRFQLSRDKLIDDLMTTQKKHLSEINSLKARVNYISLAFTLSSAISVLSIIIALIAILQ